MRMAQLLLAKTLIILAYEGEEVAGDKGGDKGAGGEGGDKPKTFTQDDLNRILAEEKRKNKATFDKTYAELEAVKSKANLTSQERQELETRMEDMRNAHMTQAEILKQNAERDKKTFEGKLSTAEKEAQAWRARFTASTISRDITGAAVKSDAFNPSQIVALLTPDTRLVEDTDAEGKPNGVFVAKVKITDKDKDGKTITLDLPVDEAVKKLTEKDEFANLFKGKGTGGLGGQNRDGKAPDIENIARTDPAKYRELRKAGKVAELR